MRTCARGAVAAAITMALAGCAGVDFYTSADLKTETGIPIYAPKPYLLVARTGAKDKPVEVSIVYLADTQRVIYAKPRSGFGSSKLTLGLTNGQLTSFGQETDPKLAELITSVAGLVTARGNADKATAEADSIRSKIGTTLQGSTPLVEVADQVEVVAKEIELRLKEKDFGPLTGDERQKLGAVVQALTGAIRIIRDPAMAPEAPKQLDVVKAQANVLGKFPPPTTSTFRDQALLLVQAWKARLDVVFKDAQPEKSEPPTFELYEIVQEAKGPSLKRVNP